MKKNSYENQSQLFGAFPPRWNEIIIQSCTWIWIDYLLTQQPTLIRVSYVLYMWHRTSISFEISLHAHTRTKIHHRRKKDRNSIDEESKCYDWGTTSNFQMIFRFVFGVFFCPMRCFRLATKKIYMTIARALRWSVRTIYKEPFIFKLWYHNVSKCAISLMHPIVPRTTEENGTPSLQGSCCSLT